MTPTILSLWLPHLPTDRIARAAGTAGAGGEDGASGDTGRVTVAKVRGAQRIAAVDHGAGTHGIRPGMALADARAIRPTLRVHPADLPGDAAGLAAIADWCSRFTPLVALDGGDGLLLDITGAAHLFGGETSLMESLEGGLRRQGFAARAAIAATPEAAWALARFSTVRLCPPASDAKRFGKVMEPLPLAALRLDAEVVRTMTQAGLRRVGDLVWRPRAPLAARFGDALFARLDGLMGQAKTPISPRFDPPSFVAERRFASPLTLAPDIERTLLALSHHLCALMERHAKGARRIEARLFRVDGAVRRLEVGTSRPLIRAEELARLFRERIDAFGEDGLDTGYGFDLVRLSILVAEPVLRGQDSLLADGDRLVEEDLAGLVDRLGARLGLGAVTRLTARQTHIPEEAAAAVPLVQGGVVQRPRPQDPSPRRGEGGRRPDEGSPTGNLRPASAGEGPCATAPARPIRLFARPEPIETVAAVPDGPPLRFRWRRTSHEVAAIEGPERIAPEWWKTQETMLTRDYFRAEDRDGRQFWLFREGLYARETAQPRWYLHGLFG